MIKVYIAPDYYKVPEHADRGGIRRVCEGMIEHFHKFDIEVVHQPREANVIINHATSLVEHPGIPSININHGLMWSRYPWGDGMDDVNRELVESMRHAVAWTAPSDWVNRAIRRGGYFYPETVYHGVNADEFKPGTNGGYVLWNKLRADFVSDPGDMMKVAYKLQDRQFWSTISHPGDNIKIIGATSHVEMKKIVANAGVYLVTPRETFGIGTLEAMACGVPIAGWDWGGQAEIVVQGETGYLAPPGDYNALAECIERCIAERDRLSANCIADVKERWGWEPRIEQYADIVKRVHQRYNETKGPKVSVVVTAYKLDAYLPKCLDTIKEQTFKDFECIVVDDAQLKSTEMIVREYAKADQRFRYAPTPHNFGLVGARNYGASIACGAYIRHVDADDFLSENAVELEAAALDKDRGIDICYGHLQVVGENGSPVLDTRGVAARSDWPPDQFNWYQQMAHLNQLPSCMMARREVFERSGGYRERMERQEDAEFNCRVSSLGIRIQKVTQAVTYFHRQRNDSKGETEWRVKGAEPDWTAWFPWRMGASNYTQARDILRKGGHPNPHLVPFGSQAKPPDGLKFWYVHDHAYPVVSIVVTCGPGHKRYLLDALDSIQAQTFPDWECVVVNDTGEKWDSDIMGAPWATIINMDGNQGTAAARNEGYKHTKAPYVVWMDADDYWLPWFLQKLVGYAEYNLGVIYSDLIMQKEKFEVLRFDEFVPERTPLGMQYAGSSVLIPRKVADAVLERYGGWNTEIPGQEDFNYQICVHSLGYCAYHVPEPLFVYRMTSSTKRESDYNNIDAIKTWLDRTWNHYRVQGEKLMCGCNQKKVPLSKTPTSMLTSSGNFTQESIRNVVQSDDKSQMVVLEYIGPLRETFSLRSRMDRNIMYRFGNNETHRARPVLLGDAEWLLGQGDDSGKPTYRIVSVGGAAETLDPSAFLGQPIAA